MRSLTAVLTAALVLLPAAPAWAANQAPLVVDDAVTYRNTGGIDYIVNALANDSDPDGDTLTYTAVTPAAKGNAYLKDGKLWYKPYLANVGTDSFSYTVADGQGNTATGTVTATLWVDPALPAGIAISSSDPGSVTVTWSAAARAAEYRIYRDRQLVGSTSDLTWTDTGLLDTGSYGYQISSVNGGGYEPFWYHAPTVYRRAPLPTPTALVVDVTDDPTTLALTWSAGGRLGPWNVYRDGALVASPMTPHFEDAGLVTGREYTYQVQHAFRSTSLEVVPASALSAAVLATPVVLTDIDRFFRDHPGSLGPVTVPERAVPGGRQQDHQDGVILQQDGETPWAVTGTLADAYLGLDGATGDLGFPVAAQENGLRDDGIGQFFENGSIWDSRATPPAIVPWFIQDGWATSGWEEGPLGYPLGDLFESDGGFAQEFEGGAVYWSEETGSHGVASPIFERWATAGYEGGALGYPTADEIESARGLRQSFTGGTIWWSPSVGAQVVGTTVQSAWARSGWENGPLGEPNGAEGALAGGRYQRFQGGYVYWSPATGAQAVVGAIRTAWGRSGSEKGPLGYPTSDEIALPDGGRYQKFQGGYVFWTASTGAWPIYGAFRTIWGSTGSQTGRLGYPTSDQTLSGGKRRQSFQRGTITVEVATGRSTITYR